MLQPRPRPMALGLLLAATLLPVGALAAPAPQTEPSASGCYAEPGGTLMLDPATSGNTTRTPFRAVTGVPFSLTLDSNRSTGYSWQFTEPYDDTILQLDSHAYHRPSDAAPGAGGTETWTFTALCPGATTVTFEYRRPWEPSSPTDRRVTFDITVD